MVEVLGYLSLDAWRARGHEYTSVLGTPIMADFLSTIGSEVWVQWNEVVLSLRRAVDASHDGAITGANSFLVFIRTPQVMQIPPTLFHTNISTRLQTQATLFHRNISAQMQIPPTLFHT